MTTIAPAQKAVIKIIMDRSPLDEAFKFIRECIGEKNYNTFLDQMTLTEIVTENLS